MIIRDSTGIGAIAILVMNTEGRGIAKLAIGVNTVNSATQNVTEGGLVEFAASVIDMGGVIAAIIEAIAATIANGPLATNTASFHIGIVGVSTSKRASVAQRADGKGAAARESAAATKIVKDNSGLSSIAASAIAEADNNPFTCNPLGETVTFATTHKGRVVARLCATNKCDHHRGAVWVKGCDERDPLVTSNAFFSGTAARVANAFLSVLQCTHKACIIDAVTGVVVVTLTGMGAALHSGVCPNPKIDDVSKCPNDNSSLSSMVVITEWVNNSFAAASANAASSMIETIVVF
jgi:hypothetical protein